VASGRPDLYDLAVLDGDFFGASFALGRLDGQSPDSWTVEQFDSLGVVGSVGEGLIFDEHDDGFPPGGVAWCEVLVQVVLGHGG